MTARDTIAHAIHLTDPGHEAVDNVIAAIRAMPVEDQAELIGAWVEYHAGKPRVLHPAVEPTGPNR